MSERAQMTEEVLRKWLKSLNIPTIVDVTVTNIPETFYVTFNGYLTDSDKQQLSLVGFQIAHDDSSSYGVSRYLVSFKGL